MEEFVLPIDTNKFRSTNAKWNELMLNDPWSVGYVSTLIEIREWKTKEEWEQFYYESGKERNKLLGDNAQLLNNFGYVRQHKQDIYGLSWPIKNLNYQYGRTQEDLMNRAEELFQHVKNNGYNLSLDECFECVRFRTICETWNGIIIREQNTVRTLQRLLPDVLIEKTTGEVDHTYAVDYELYKNSRLICGIQIKPQTYMSNAPYIQKARYANAQKYNEYRTLYGVPVITIISKSNGIILNNEAVERIKTM